MVAALPSPPPPAALPSQDRAAAPIAPHRLRETARIPARSLLRTLFTISPFFRAKKKARHIAEPFILYSVLVVGMAFQALHMLTTNITGSIMQKLLTGSVITISNRATTVLAVFQGVIFLIIFRAESRSANGKTGNTHRIKAGAGMRATIRAALDFQVFYIGVIFRIDAVMIGRLTIIFFWLLSLATDVNPTGFCWQV